jgi:type I restriction enzyme M protein
MRSFATESGKSKGNFYTPAEVSRVIAKVIRVGNARSKQATIHDPTCGSGSLLLKAHDEAKTRTGYDLALYGQEMDNATQALARMNMLLHECDTAEIWKDNTLAHPHFLTPKGGLKTFDFVVANPPFSSKAWSSGLKPDKDEWHRFAFGVPPAKNGDYAFLLHVLATLNSTGKGAIILPHGVLFRGNAEAVIRKELVQRGYIEAIIGLPPNLFYGTGIPACLVVLDKEHAAGRKGIFMIDASRGFLKDGNKNRLRDRDIHLIVDAFNRRLERPRYSRLVPVAEIEENDFNLNLPRYIDSSEPEDLQDLGAHLHGGIPADDVDALDPYWKVFGEVYTALFTPAERSGYVKLQVPVGEVKATIFGHPQFTAFQKKTTGVFAKWKRESTPKLEGITIGDKPKALIEALGESVLQAFHKVQLVDPYDVYQHVMDYWAEAMQDDVYLIASDGWEKAARLRVIVDDKDKKVKEKADFTVGKTKYKTDLILRPLLLARYLRAEQADIARLESELAEIDQKLEELREEHGGEEGLLAGVMDDGYVSKAALTKRLKEIETEPDAEKERMMLGEYRQWMEQQVVGRKDLKEAEKLLELRTVEKYAELSEGEIKALVIHDKWLASLTTAVQGEMNRVSQVLTGRVRELAERYATPLPTMVGEVERLAVRVDGHLKKMGVVWN